MKKHIFFLLLFIQIMAVSIGQKTIPDFGQIDLSDLQLNSCSFEPDANAMKLFDVRESEFEPSPFVEKIRTERRVRIKIFNEKGYPFATVKIPYYSNKKNSSISDLKGIVYSLDNSGKINTQKIEESDFFKTKAMDKIGLLSFTFPSLQPGCVIEYSYTLTEKNSSQFDTWVVQSEIPTAYVSNTLIIPAYSNFKEFVFGIDSILKRTEPIKKGLDRNKTTFYTVNVPSFKSEPYMSSLRDNLPRMYYLYFPKGNVLIEDFSPASLWKNVANRILRSDFFEEQFRKIIRGTEKIVDTALSMVNKNDRVKYLVQAVKKRIPESKSQSSFPDDINDTWKNRTGSSAEINMLLMNLFKRSDINCYPVLISTRDNGKINLDFPSFGQFNSMDVLVMDNDITYLIDASLRFQPYNIPPMNILNRQVFILDPDNIRWALINDDRPLQKQTASIFALLTKEGKINATVTVEYFDFTKSMFLDSTGKDVDDDECRFVNKKIPGLKVLSDYRENPVEEDPLVQKIEFIFEPQNTNEFYYFSPQRLTNRKTNPFIQDKRNTDIDFGCNKESLLKMHLEIPENFSVEHLPENIILRSPDSSLTYTRIIYANRSNISFTQKLEIKRALFDKNEYAGLYEFFNRIQSFMTDEIIIKKIK